MGRELTALIFAAISLIVCGPAQAKGPEPTCRQWIQLSDAKKAARIDPKHRLESEVILTIGVIVDRVCTRDDTIGAEQLGALIFDLRNSSIGYVEYCLEQWESVEGSAAFLFAVERFEETLRRRYEPGAGATLEERHRWRIVSTNELVAIHAACQLARIFEPVESPETVLDSEPRHWAQVTVDTRPNAWIWAKVYDTELLLGETPLDSVWAPMGTVVICAEAADAETTCKKMRVTPEKTRRYQFRLLESKHRKKSRRHKPPASRRRSSHSHSSTLGCSVNPDIPEARESFDDLRFDAAQEILEHALKSAGATCEEELWYIHLLRGYIEATRGERKACVESFRTVLAIRPEFRPRANEPEKFRRCFDRALEISPLPRLSLAVEAVRAASVGDAMLQGAIEDDLDLVHGLYFFHQDQGKLGDRIDVVGLLTKDPKDPKRSTFSLKLPAGRHGASGYLVVATDAFGNHLRSKIVQVAPPNIKDAKSAAAYAAQLANAECKRLYDAQPFRADSFVAKKKKGRWHWGRFDPATHTGYSAEVSFLRDGSQARVRVFLALDEVRRGGEQKREELHLETEGK